MGFALWGQIERLVETLSRSESSLEGEGLTSTLEHSWPFPPWATLLGLILAALFVLGVYFREQGAAGRRQRIALALLRVALITIAVYMMYGWTQQYHRTDLPDVVVMLDDSSSMAVVDAEENDSLRRRRQRQVEAAGMDEASRFNLARALLLDSQRGWLDRIARDYRIKFYCVGESVRSQLGTVENVRDKLRAMEADGKTSRLGQGLQDVLDAQRGRPTAAIVWLTDGVTTEGETISDVAEYARRKSIPLLLVGLGSDEPPRDVRLSDLLVDDVVFVDEMVNFELKLHGDGFEGQTATVRLKRRDRPETLAERSVLLPRDGSSVSVRLSYRPQQEGDFEHIVDVASFEGEVNTGNNRVTRRVLVRDATLRVLLVQAYPSYEYRYLKDLLGRTVRKGGDGSVKAVDLTTVLQEADLEHSRQDAAAQGVFPVRREELFAYDVLVFGDVNPGFLSRSAMENVVDFVTERGGGMVFLAGPSYTPLAFRDTPLASLLPIDLATASAPSADDPLAEGFHVKLTPTGLLSPHLQLGDAPDDTQRIWQQLPALHWSLTAPDLRSAARVLAIDPSRTTTRGENVPIIMMQFAGAGKVVLHATDESFRWSRYPGNEQRYSRYWLQTLRYLSRAKLLSSDGPAEITTDREQYRRGDTVRLRVRFFDERQAPTDDAGVVVVVQRSGGRKQQVTLHRDNTRRGLFLGTISGLADGQYRVWLATAGEQAAPRYFAIAAPPGEQARIAMDSGELSEAAKLSRGKFYTLDTANRLVGELPRGRRVTIESLPPRSIWNSPFIVGTFVLLLTLEWLLRKRVGMI